MTLSYQWIRPHGEQVKTFMMIHGILGSKRNWISFAKKLAEHLPDWQGIVVDLRHHGESHNEPDGFVGANTIDACAKDLSDLRLEIGVEPNLVSGHSFGGKVVMRYAEKYADDLQYLFVLDSSPGKAEYLTAEQLYVGSDIGKVLHMVKTAPMPVKDRRALRTYVINHGLSNSLALWMTTNLKNNPEGEGLVWRFKIEKIEELLADYAQQDCWPFLTSSAINTQLTYVRGARSNRFSRQDIERLQQLDGEDRIDFRVLDDAGHWVHSDNPEGLLEIFLNALN